MQPRRIPDRTFRHLRSVRDEIDHLLNASPVEVPLETGRQAGDDGLVADDDEDYPEWFLVVGFGGECASFQREHMGALLAALVRFARERDIPFTLPT